MEEKYLIVPGQVRSRSDGDTHYISAQELIRLYGVNPKECKIVEQQVLVNVDRLEKYYPGLIELRPRYDGKYRETFEEIQNKKRPNLE